MLGVLSISKWTIIILMILSSSSETLEQNSLTNEQFIESYLDPELGYWTRYTKEECKKQSVEFDSENMRSRFYSCLHPQFENFTMEELAMLNQSLQELGSRLVIEVENNEFSNDFLQHFKTNVLSHFCNHVPVILECFNEEYEDGIFECWPLNAKILFSYVYEILPSVCEFQGLKMEDLFTIEGQKCVANYKEHIDMCIDAINLNWKISGNRHDFCDFVPCLERIGQNFPCEDEKSEIILKYLFDDAQLSRRCVLKTYMHEEVEMECKESEIVPDKEEFDDLGMCFGPFISAYHYMSRLSNSTIQNTRYGSLIYEIFDGNFEMEASALCQIFDSNSCNSTKDLIEECYSPSASYRGFLTYLEYIIGIQCGKDNATEIKEMLVNEKLECLHLVVDGLIECIEEYNDVITAKKTESTEDYWSCETLKFYQNCSTTTLLNSCKNLESFAILENLLLDIEYNINATECSSLTLSEMRSPIATSEMDDKQLRLKTVLIYVMIGVLFIVFVFVIVSIICIKLGLVPFGIPTISADNA